MSLIKLFIYIIFLIISFHTQAINNQTSADTFAQASANKKLPDDIDGIFQCRGFKSCCLPVKSKFCELFYSICNTKTFKLGQIMSSKADLSNSQSFDRIKKGVQKNPKNTVLVLIDRKLYFAQAKYDALAIEIMNNLDTLEKTDDVKDPKKNNQPAYHSTKDYIKDALSKTKSGRFPKRGIKFRTNSYDNMEQIFQFYNSLLSQFDSKERKLITIYNPNKKRNCERQSKPTDKNIDIITLSSTENTLPIITNHSFTATENTLPIITNTVINNFNEQLNNQQHSANESINLPVIITTVASSLITATIIITGIFCIYKHYKRSNLNKDAKTPKISVNKLETKISVVKAESEEHIYENPYDIPIKLEVFNNQNQHDKINTSVKKFSLTEEHIYIPCISEDNAEHLEVASSETSINTQQIVNDSSMNEQQTNVVLPIEGSTHVYHILESKNENETNDIDIPATRDNTNLIY